MEATYRRSPVLAASFPPNRLRASLKAAALTPMEGAAIKTSLTLGLVGLLAGALVFGALAPALAAAFVAAGAPVVLARRREQIALENAREGWPQIIDEIRLLTGNAGYAIPTAFFEAGLKGPEPFRPTFVTTHRQWLLTRDFQAATEAVRDRLQDPAADSLCETLLVATELGGTDLDLVLRDLADDRRQDAEERKDAQSRLAGARFARRFVLLVPLGMAASGLVIGNGKAAFATATGQLLFAVAIGLVISCWFWASKLMELGLGQHP